MFFCLFYRGATGETVKSKPAVVSLRFLRLNLRRWEDPGAPPSQRSFQGSTCTPRLSSLRNGKPTWISDQCGSSSQPPISPGKGAASGKLALFTSVHSNLDVQSFGVSISTLQMHWNVARCCVGSRLFLNEYFRVCCYVAMVTVQLSRFHSMP